MAAGPIYDFTGDMSWASNFHDGHLIALPVGATGGPLKDVAWLHHPDILELAAIHKLIVTGNCIVLKGNERPFQAFKTSTPEVAVQILAADSAGASKKMGRSTSKGGLVGDLHPEWDEGFAQRCMAWLLNMKYMDTSMRSKLVRTGYRMLVEGNTWGDVRWGAVWVPLPAGGWVQRPRGKCWGRRQTEDLVTEELWGENWLGRLTAFERARIDCGVAVSEVV